MTYRCPKGHDSTDADYCSECGARIGAAPAVTAPAAAPAASGGADNVCPDCGTERAPGSRFCEVCRYDFVSKASLSAAAPSPASTLVQSALPEPKNYPPMPPVAAPAVPAPDLVVPVSYERLQVLIAADASMVKDPDPANPFPQGTPDRVFHLDLADNLVGRFSESKDSHPEIPVKDPGVSRRHMKLLRRADGGFAALELGSSNGTLLNGAPLEPGVETALKAGDVLELGMWTRMTIQVR